ncbi:hypothetical protein, partial [Haloferax sp. Atlit-47N]|uniref:hypothetical protein n=1 Tax=Haloferax sp. Atlit-47N TaxID=2077199 RepID=UPI001F19DE03
PDFSTASKRSVTEKFNRATCLVKPTAKVVFAGNVDVDEFVEAHLGPLVASLSRLFFCSSLFDP